MSPILVTDKAGVILWVNEEVCKLVDCVDQELVGSALTDHLSDDSKADLGRELAEVKAPGQIVRYEGTFMSPRGTEVKLSFRIYPVVELETQEFLYHVSVGTNPTKPRPDAGAGAGADEIDEFRRTYEHTSLSFSDGERLFARTEAIVQGESLFLDPDFSLEDAAHRLATNQLYLSQAINFFTGGTFRTYLNDKRFGYLSREGPKLARLSVDELWHMAGFGSYSTFRRYLKQERGIAPRELVARLRQQLSR